jgi:hypothetical protein
VDPAVTDAPLRVATTTAYPDFSNVSFMTPASFFNMYSRSPDVSASRKNINTLDVSWEWAMEIMQAQNNSENNNLFIIDPP